MVSSDGPQYGSGRQALLEAVIRIVARDGLRNLTYRAVAREAGVANTLVSHHFGNRQAMLQAALELSLSRSVGYTTSAPGSGSITALFEDLAKVIAPDQDEMAFQYELILEARRRPELLLPVEELYAAYRSACARELQASGMADEPDLVHLVIAAVDGLIFQQLCMPDAVAFSQALDRLRLLLELVRTDQRTRPEKMADRS